MPGYGVLDAVRDSPIFFVSPARTAGRLKDSPPASYKTLIGAVIFYAVVAVLLQVAVVGLRLSAPPGHSHPSQALFLAARGAGAVAGASLLALFSFLGAAILHLVARWGGAQENSYRRNYQLQALLAFQIPLHVAINVFLAALPSTRILAGAGLALWNIALSVEGISQFHRITRWRAVIGYLKFLLALILVLVAFGLLAAVLRGFVRR